MAEDVTFTCATCSKRLRVREAAIGRVARCPNCRSQFQIARSPDGQLAVVAILDSPPEPPSRATAALAPRPPVPIARRIDVPAAPAPPPPEPAPWGDPDVRPTPFFVGSDAVVDCPWCGDRLRLGSRHFNKPSRCPSCENGLYIRVSRRGYIDIECPDCLTEMEVPERMAGRRTRCVRSSCGYPIDVPHSPIEVEMGDTKERLAAKGQAQADAVLTGILVMGAALGGRRGLGSPLCFRCGLRHVRNPTGICYVCRGR